MDHNEKHFRRHGKGKGPCVSLSSINKNNLIIKKQKQKFKFRNCSKNLSSQHSPTSCIGCFIDFTEFISKRIEPLDDFIDYLKLSNEIFSYGNSLKVECKSKTDELINEFLNETICM